MRRSVLLALVCLLLWTTQAFAAPMRFDNFSVNIPAGWETATGNFTRNIPVRLADIFDGADASEKNLRLVGWKSEGGKHFPASFAVICNTDTSAGFNKLLQAATPEERTRIATRFADILAQKVQQDYVERLSMDVEENAVEVIDAGAMTVVLADAVVKDGNAVRTRSATIFFHKDSMVQIITIYDQKYPELAKVLDEIPTTLDWVEK